MWRLKILCTQHNPGCHRYDKIISEVPVLLLDLNTAGSDTVKINWIRQYN